MWGNQVEFNELVGKKLVSIKGLESRSEEVVFTCSDGTQYKMYHEQDCCETVDIEDVVGYVEDLLNTPIVMAEESTKYGEESDWGTSTWTFYKLATDKGYVTIRWYGESNGYYSESVHFEEVK